MQLPDINLWNRLMEFELDDPDSDFTFTDRLSRENDWSLEFSILAVEEYKRFMYLICVGGHPMTPSDHVDQVWHLHLLYTQSYWQDFCRDVLNQQIHHGPTKGGNNEKAKYDDWYARTKETYQTIFETPPPENIWPPHEIRFGQLIFTRVNRHTHWVFPKITFNKLFKWKK